jgi:hypothetical protein
MPLDVMSSGKRLRKHVMPDEAVHLSYRRRLIRTMRRYWKKQDMNEG